MFLLFIMKLNKHNILYSNYNIENIAEKVSILCCCFLQNCETVLNIRII